MIYVNNRARTTLHAARLVVDLVEDVGGLSKIHLCLHHIKAYFTYSCGWQQQLHRGGVSDEMGQIHQEEKEAYFVRSS